jgi:hypothetical protein
MLAPKDHGNLFDYEGYYGKRQRRSTGHIETSTGTVQQLPAEVSSSSGSLGEGAIVVGNKIYWTYNKPWIERLIKNYGNTASLSSRETAT